MQSSRKFPSLLIILTKHAPSKIQGAHGSFEGSCDCNQNSCKKDPQIRLGVDDVAATISRRVDTNASPVQPMVVKLAASLEEQQIPQGPSTKEKRPALGLDTENSDPWTEGTRD